jgi:hypothetical protein
VQKNNGVLDERLQKFSGGEIFRKNFFERERFRAERFEHDVVFLNAARKFFFEPRRVNQIIHAQTDARRLVAVSRADAALGGADFIFALEHFALRIQFAVIRKNDVRRFAQDEILRRDLDADFLQADNFLDEADRVNDHAVADDAQFIFAQNARRHEVQDVFFWAEKTVCPALLPPA